MNKTIDEILKDITNKFSKQAITAFIAAIIVGFFSHLFVLTNEFFNHDDIGAWMEQHSKPSETRWFQSLLINLVSPIGSGMLAGSLTIIIIAISALILTDYLQIKSKVMAAVLGSMMTASPIVACFMSYVNGSYAFVVGLPFAIVAVCLYEKGIKGFVAAALCIMCSIAGYQSNISITIALLYIVLFTRLLEKDIDLKKWWASFGKACCLLLLGLVLYFVSNKVVVAITGDGGLSGANGFSVGIATGDLELEGYEAQTQTGTVYLKEIPQTVIVAIKYFIKYNFNIFFDGANISFASKLNVFSSIILAISGLIAVIEALFKRKGLWQKLMIILVFLMMPICINSVQIILNGKCDETLNMMYCMIMLVPLIISVLENASFKSEKIRNLLISISAIAFVLHIYGNIQLINDAYQRMNSSYEAAYSIMCRVIDRVEQLPQWQEGNHTLYFDYGEDEGGYLINDNYQTFAKEYEAYIDMGWMGIFGTGVYDFWSNQNTGNFVKCYFGLEYDSPTEQQLDKIKATKEYENLSKFPSSDSIKVINDVIIVRIDD